MASELSVQGNVGTDAFRSVVSQASWQGAYCTTELLASMLLEKKRQRGGQGPHIAATLLRPNLSPLGSIC